MPLFPGNTIKSYHVLSQLSPNATTATTAYTVPSAKSTTISTIVVCNANAIPITFRISIRVAASADDIKQYLYYDVPVLGNDTFASTIGITLTASDIISVYASSTNVSFNIFGVEIS